MILRNVNKSLTNVFLRLIKLCRRKVKMIRGANLIEVYLNHPNIDRKDPHLGKKL